MTRAITFATGTRLHESMCRRMMLGREFDHVPGNDGVQLHDFVGTCSSFELDYDLKRLWIPASRWRMMVRQYLDANDVATWLDKIGSHLVPGMKNKSRGVAYLRTKTVQGYGTGKGVRRRWGSCMIAMSYRTNPTPQITLISRTTYFGYLALLDMSVAHALGREVSKIVDIPVEEMQFRWCIEQAQFHGFRSLAWALGDPEIKALMDDDIPSRLSISPKVDPGYRRALDGYERILKSDRAGKLYGDEAYSSFARVRRRFHTEVYGPDYAAQFDGGKRRTSPFAPLPSLYVSDLDLSALRGGTSEYEEEDDDGDED
jgi:hypothetical protein